MTNTGAKKSVLILCGDYMEDHQVMVPFQALQAYGVSVDAVCPGKKAGDNCRTSIHQQLGHQTYSESRGHNFTLNATFDEVDESKYDGLIVPGGRAPEYLAMNGSVLSLVSKFSDSVKPIASTCHGQLILAAAGLLKGRKCTGPPPIKPVVCAAGAHWVEPGKKSCVIDGNLITGSAYVWHVEFIQLFVGALGGKVAGPEKRILFLCGDYMEDYEVVVPFQSLEALGCCQVDTVCPKKKVGEICPTAVHDFEGDQTYSEKPGHDFTLNADFEKSCILEYDALVIPGGRAPEYLAVDEKVITLVRKFMEAGKPIASICHGQQILAAAGVLEAIKIRMAPKKVYVVFEGRIPGIYHSWMECKRQVDRFSGNSYKGYETMAEAVEDWNRYQIDTKPKDVVEPLQCRDPPLQLTGPRPEPTEAHAESSEKISVVFNNCSFYFGERERDHKE